MGMRGHRGWWLEARKRRLRDTVSEVRGSSLDIGLGGDGRWGMGCMAEIGGR